MKVFRILATHQQKPFILTKRPAGPFNKRFSRFSFDEFPALINEKGGFCFAVPAVNNVRDIGNEGRGVN